MRSQLNGYIICIPAFGANTIINIVTYVPYRAKELVHFSPLGMFLVLREQRLCSCNHCQQDSLTNKQICHQDQFKINCWPKTQINQYAIIVIGDITVTSLSKLYRIYESRFFHIT